MKKENKNSPEADTLKLIHELEVCRIELEMQNGEMQNKELERFNDLIVGREMKMIDLKKEINMLLKQLGEEEKYKIVE